jgi:hypothetical protein
MRATLFLSSLFVLSLLSTAALAEKPGGAVRKERVSRVSESRARETKAEVVRSRADVQERHRASRTHRSELQSKERATPSSRGQRSCSELGNACAGRKEKIERAGDKLAAHNAAERRRGEMMFKKLLKMLCEKRAGRCEANL